MVTRIRVKCLDILLNKKEEVIDRSIPVNNSLLTGVDPVNNSLLTGVDPVNNSLLTGSLYNVGACAHWGGCWLGSPGPIELIARRRLAIPAPPAQERSS